MSWRKQREFEVTMLLAFFFFPFIFISWRLITLQYCSGFCHTLTWISHGFTCVPHPDPSPTSLLALNVEGRTTSQGKQLATAAAESLQSRPTLCDPRDSSPPGSPVPGILQARTLGWVAIAFSNAWKWKVKVKSLSHVRLSATPWTAAHQAPPSMGFSRQEDWSGLPLPSLAASH